MCNQRSRFFVVVPETLPDNGVMLACDNLAFQPLEKWGTDIGLLSYALNSEALDYLVDIFHEETLVRPPQSGSQQETHPHCQGFMDKLIKYKTPITGRLSECGPGTIRKRCDAVGLTESQFAGVVYAHIVASNTLGFDTDTEEYRTRRDLIDFVLQTSNNPSEGNISNRTPKSIAFKDTTEVLEDMVAATQQKKALTIQERRAQVAKTTSYLTQVKLFKLVLVSFDVLVSKYSVMLMQRYHPGSSIDNSSVVVAENLKLFLRANRGFQQVVR